MGGGVTNRPEVALRLNRQADTDSGSASDGTEVDLTQPICERDHVITFVLERVVQIGDLVHAVLGDPVTLVSGGASVGHVTDPRQAATLTACINAGYRVAGNVASVDMDAREGLAVLTGVR